MYIYSLVQTNNHSFVKMVHYGNTDVKQWKSTIIKVLFWGLEYSVLTIMFDR